MRLGSRSSRFDGRSTIRSRAIRWRSATRRPSGPKRWLSTSALSRPHRPDLRDHPRSGSALVLVPADAPGTSAGVQGVQIIAGRLHPLDRAHRLQGPDRPAARPSPRKHRNPHPGVFLIAPCRNHVAPEPKTYLQKKQHAAIESRRSSIGTKILERDNPTLNNRRNRTVYKKSCWGRTSAHSRNC